MVADTVTVSKATEALEQLNRLTVQELTDLRQHLLQEWSYFDFRHRNLPLADGLLALSDAVKAVIVERVKV